MPENTQSVAVDRLVTDPRLQHRADSRDYPGCANPERAEGYKQLLESGVPLPPPKAARLDKKLYLYDGFHTLAAHALLGRKSVQVQVSDAADWGGVLWLGASANHHGAPNTSRERKAILKELLSVWRYWTLSDRQLAIQAGMPRASVAAVRETVKAPTPPPDPAQEAVAGNGEAEPPAPDVRKVKRGETEYPMKTGKIGKKQGRKKKEKAAKHLRKDKTGQPVPEGLHDVFGDSWLEDSAGDLRQLIKEAKSHLRWAVWTRLDDVIADLERAEGVLMSGRPFAVCPSCHGEGCKHCKSSGWLPEHAYHAVLERIGQEETRETEETDAT